MRRKVLAAVLGASLLISAAGTTPALAGSRGDELQGEINDLHKKQDENKKESKEKQDKLEKVKNKKNNAVQEVRRLSSQIDKTTNKIGAKKSDVSDTKDDIDRLKTKINKTKKRIKKRDKLLKDRVRSMYENGGSVNYVSVILNATNFSDFLDRVMALNLITKQDKNLLEKQKADKKSLEKDKDDVEQKLDHLQDQLDELEDLKAGLDKKKEKKKELTNQLKAKESKVHKDISNREKAMKVIESQISDTTQKKEKIKREEEARKREAARKKREAEKRKREAQQRKDQESKNQTSNESHQTKQHADKDDSKSSTANESVDGKKTVMENHVATESTGSGQFIVPVSGGVSSGYGWRTLNGKPDYHDGIDYSAPTGTPIHAAAAGTVKFAGPASGFGNWIVIDHGGGLYTIYGHMYDDGIKVSPGQHVSQGQAIGSVGSNGQSTGSHLHFGVAKGSLSNRIDPNSFF